MKDRLLKAKRKPSIISSSKKKSRIERWKNASPEEKLLCAFQLHELGMKLKGEHVNVERTD